MFYFPVVSSGIEIERCKRKINKLLDELYEDLENLLSWEETYNRETCSKKEPSEYYNLKNSIDKIKENN